MCDSPRHRSAPAWGSSLLVAWAFFAVAVTARGGGLDVAPARVDLSDAFSRRQLVVSSPGGDVTTTATYESSNPSVATIDQGFVVPQGIGETLIRVRHGDGTAEIPVRVTGFDTKRSIDFVTEIQPLLTRYGCNAGGCHGKASGQNGFKLSLFGFDSDFDYRALLSEGRGRRISVSSPDRSLLLLKAVASVPHGGGRRFEIGSEPYSALRSWIESGAPAAAAESPKLLSLRVEPAERLLKPGSRQQVAVVASYANGTERDVTRQTEFASNLDVIANVTDRGLITATGQTGEATIMARYMGQVAVFRAIVPHGAPRDSIPDFEAVTEIDRLAAEKWKKLGLLPSKVVDDATFLRRITIDVCGRLPTVDETRTFLADSAADKRTRLVDRLLESPDYAAYAALQWSAILRNSNLAGSTNAAYAFHNWIKDSIARNRPYDEFVRGIVAASGEWKDAPAINWYWQSRDDQLHMVTADTGQLFLGIRLQCARCHHHPYERWGQEDYYGLAGFFTRLGRKSFGEPPPYFSSATVTTGERNPLTGQAPEPKYPDGEYAKFSASEDPRHALVDWMVRPENPYFAKALVNRQWSHFFGRGLVNEVDDMRATNPPSNPELLDFLAREFVAHKYDVRHVVRLILTSRLYQLSSEPRPENEHDRQNFARFYARRMIAEVIHDAVDTACGTHTNFGNMSASARAVDLPHEGFGSYFLDTFDRPQRVSVCECERSAGATLSQVLLLANSDEVENKIASGEGRIQKLVAAKTPAEAIVDELYLAAYSRLPTADEKQTSIGYISGSMDQAKGAQDVLWALLNSREFLFNR